MNDLSPRARRFIARTRTGDDPCPADERRVERELERRIASGAVAIGAGASVAKAAGAAAGWGKAIVWVAVGVGATVGALELRSGSPVTASPPAVSASTPAIARVSSSSRAETEIVDPSSVGSASPKPRGALSAARDQSALVEVDPGLPPRRTPPVASFDVVPEPVSSVATTDRLAAETAALRTAQQAMRSGRPAEALALLDRQDALYPAGALAQERAAARVLALCELGQVGAGRAAAQAFEQRWPRSPLLGRVRTACDVR
jgi:hypothetical protein